MKLTHNQIKQIEEKLYKKYDFYYDDARHEVIDHIASEIEEEMKTESFEVSFDKVFEKWNDRLEETEWSGMHLYGKIKMPLFYKDQLMPTFRNDLILWALISIFVPLLIYFFQDAMKIETIDNTVFFYKITVFIIAIFLNKYTLEKYQNGRYTTVYGQIAAFSNKKTFPALMLMAISMILMQSNTIKYKENIELWLGVLVFFNAFYFMFIIKYCNYFRHLKMIKKYSKMETRLTNQQIDFLFSFTKKHLVEHYDVQIELVDHLANAIEEQWKENPNISFEDALEKEYKKFGVFGFSGLLEQKQAALQSHYWDIIKKEIQSFFGIPRILLSAALFYVLFHFFSNPTEIKELIWFGLKVVLFIATILLWIYQNRQLKKNQNKYLIQSISNYFYSLPCTLIVFFSSNLYHEPSLFRLILDTTTTTLYILFIAVLFTKIIPLIKNEVNLTNQKFQTL